MTTERHTASASALADFRQRPREIAIPLDRVEREIEVSVENERALGRRHVILRRE